MTNEFETKLNELLGKLKAAREQYENANLKTSSIMNKAIEDAKLSQEWTEADGLKSQALETSTSVEKQIHEMTLGNYADTMEKKPDPRVQVKLFKVFSILDRSALRAWVDKNLADALIVDEKKVRNYAMKIGYVEGTTVTEEPRVQIAREL